MDSNEKPLGKNGGSGKEQFKIYVSREVMEDMDKLYRVLTRFKRNDMKGRSRVLFSKSTYWEGVIKEHLSIPENIFLIKGFDKRKVGDEL